MVRPKISLQGLKIPDDRHPQASVGAEIEVDDSRVIRGVQSHLRLEEDIEILYRR
jgi:hypothetical protein